MGFGIDEARDRDVEYEIDDENFLVDLVRFSRSQQVLNEEQAAVVQMGIATGLMKDYEFYTSLIVTGAASSGKSHMLDNVNFEAMQYADDRHEWVYEMTGSSDQGGINDAEIDDARVAYFHELQKIPDEMLEFIKTVAEDGKFIYGRSTADSDALGGFSTDKFSRDPLPVVFSFADENTASAGKDQELRSRTVEVKVDEDPEKNAGVHDMKWGGDHITLDESEYEYIFDDPDLHHAVKSHIRDMPVGVDVTIPYGNGKFEGDDWCAADVVKPMFNFERNQSTRASANIAGLTMGSAMLNYHARDAACPVCEQRFGPDVAQEHDYECPDCSDDDAQLQIIVDPVDVANIIACRPTLLATTHGLTEKKFAVLDAILARGGQANAEGTAVHAPKQDIIDEIQENDDIATLTKSEITEILDELDENLIVNKMDNPEDRRENLFVYDGGAVFNAPDIYGSDGSRYELFEDITDPIRDQPIEQTIEQHLEDLNAKMDMESLSAAESGGEALGDWDDTDPSSLSEDAQRVAERLRDTLDGYVVPQDVWDANSLKLAHMVGDTPVQYNDGMVMPEREPSGADRVDGFMNPDNWDGVDDFDGVESRVESAVAELRSEGLMSFEAVDDGMRVQIDG